MEGLEATYANLLELFETAAVCSCCLEDAAEEAMLCSYKHALHLFPSLFDQITMSSFFI